MKCIIFDLDHTLYDFLTPNLAAAAKINEYVKEHFGIDSAEFDVMLEKAMRRTEKKVGSDIAAIHSRTLRYQTFLEDIGVPATQHAAVMSGLYWDTFYEAMEPEEHVKAFLDRLRESGRKVGICTDMTSTVQFIKIQKLGLQDSIDFIVTSEEAGSEKPSERIFDLCVEKAGCGREKCVFVGDHPKKDILGALKYGMEAVWCLRYDPFKMNDIMHFHMEITGEQDAMIKYRFKDYKGLAEGKDIYLGGLKL